MIKIRILCGCGYSTANLDDANSHANSTKHRLTISGEVHHDKIKPKATDSLDAIRNLIRK